MADDSCRLTDGSVQVPSSIVYHLSSIIHHQIMNDFSFYFSFGFEHILTITALDHILFIVALAAIYMLKDWKQVLILVTAFTLGHTITLILSVKEWVTVNETLIEFLIPCTIAVTAISNLFQRTFQPKAIRINYLLALFFGLIHGLAFANLLKMILASGQSFAFSMFSFSLGLETAQILLVLVVLLIGQLLIVLLKIERRHWVIFVSALVFGLSLEMAISRWPKREEIKSEIAQQRILPSMNKSTAYNLSNLKNTKFMYP